MHDSGASFNEHGLGHDDVVPSTLWFWSYPLCGWRGFAYAVPATYALAVLLAILLVPLFLFLICLMLKLKIIGQVPMVYIGFNIKIDPS